jgi:hypothetical protein
MDDEIARAARWVVEELGTTAEHQHTDEYACRPEPELVHSPVTRVQRSYGPRLWTEFLREQAADARQAAMARAISGRIRLPNPMVAEINRLFDLFMAETDDDHECDYTCVEPGGSCDPDDWVCNSCGRSEAEQR